MSKVVTRMVANTSDTKLHRKHYWNKDIYTEYNYQCGWCNTLTNSEYVAYTTEGAVEHLCFWCRLHFQTYDHMPKSKKKLFAHG